jgi:hypothetical protein
MLTTSAARARRRPRVEAGFVSGRRTDRNRASTVPSGRAAKASLVGAKTVN